MTNLLVTKDARVRMCVCMCVYVCMSTSGCAYSHGFRNPMGLSPFCRRASFNNDTRVQIGGTIGGQIQLSPQLFTNLHHTSLQEPQPSSNTHTNQNSPSNTVRLTHTHTHTHIHIQTYPPAPVCMCVYVYVYEVRRMTVLNTTATM